MGDFGSGTYGSGTYGGLVATPGPEATPDSHLSDIGQLSPRASAWGKRQGEMWVPLGPTIGLTCDGDSWGSKKADFSIAPGRPELRRNDEVYLEMDGLKVWSGRVITADYLSDLGGGYECEGWQAHLDDDTLSAMWVHSRLPDWRDMRSFPAAGLNRLGTTAGQVTVGDGSIMIGWPKGTFLGYTGVGGGGAISDVPAVGVVLDLGPNPATWTKRVHMIYSVESMAADQFYLLVRSASENGVWEIIEGFEDYQADPYTSTQPSPATASITYTEARRYVAVLLAYVASPPSALATSIDIILKLLSIRCFRDVAYESGGASTLLVSDVVKDLFELGTTKLSRDTSLVEATSRAVSHATTEGQSGVRKSLERIAGAEGLQPKVEVDRRPSMKAQPSSTPKYLATDKATFERGTGGDAVVNKVVVASTSDDGTLQEFTRHSAELPGANLHGISTPGLTDPGFDTGVSEWTTFGAALEILDAGGEARVHINPSGYIQVGQYVQAELTGTHEHGTIYVAEINIRRDARQSWRLWYGHIDSGKWDDSNSAVFIHPGPTNTYATARVAWAPKADYSSGVFLRIEQRPNLYDPYALDTISDFYFDSIRFYESHATALDVAGTVRTRAITITGSAAIDDIAALAESYLGVYGRDRLVGTLKVPVGGVTLLPNGDPVHPSELLLDTQELVHIPSETDPVTGNPGRNGRLASVSYTDESESASVAIDERTEDLAALLTARGASVQG